MLEGEYVFATYFSEKQNPISVSTDPVAPGSFNSQRVKVPQTLLKYTLQHFCLINLFLLGILTRNTSLSVTSEILGLFVHTLAGDEKYFCL